MKVNTTTVRLSLNNQHFLKTKLLIYVLVLGLFSLLPSYSTAQFAVSTAIGGLPGGSSMSICDEDPGEYFILNWNALPSGAQNPRIDITLPDGVSYVAASFDEPTPSAEGAAFISTPSSNLIRINFPDSLASSESGQLRFRLNYNCDFIGATVSGNVFLEISAIADEGTIVSQMGPLNNTFAKSDLNLVLRNNTNVSDAEVGDIYTRTMSIQNNGVGELSEFEICFNYGSDLGISNTTIEGVAVTLDGSGCTIVNSTNYPTLSLPLGENDSLTWSENIIVNGCDIAELGTSIAGNWGCEGSFCDPEDNTSMSVALANNTPSFNEISITRTFNDSNLNLVSCIEEGAQIEVVWSINSGKAYNLVFSPEANNSNTYLDPGLVRVEDQT